MNLEIDETKLEKIEVLGVKGVDGVDETSARISEVDAKTLDVLRSYVLPLPEWTEPLEKWRGEGWAAKFVSFLNYQSECNMWWMAWGLRSDMKLSLDDVKKLLLMEIEMDKPVMSLNLYDRGPFERELAVASTAVRRIFVWNTRENGIAELKQALLSIGMMYKWRARRRKGRSGRRPDNLSRAEIVMQDVLLRKYTVMKKKERYNIIREKSIPFKLSYRDNGTIDKIMSDNRELVEVFKGGHQKWDEKRSREIREEVEGIVGEIVQKIDRKVVRQ